MRSLLLVAGLLIIAFNSIAQSKTTEALNKKYADARAFFFYNNTLRMLNQTEDKDFDGLIKDIEKMKLLWIDKSKNFSSADYEKIVTDYKSESFEPVMTSRHQGKNFDVFIKEKEGKTKGMLVLVNDSASLYVLDIVGHIALNNITKLYKQIDESSDIGQRIHNAMNANKDKKKEEDNAH